jgi:hypothetical protein
MIHQWLIGLFQNDITRHCTFLLPLTSLQTGGKSCIAPNLQNAIQSHNYIPYNYLQQLLYTKMESVQNAIVSCVLHSSGSGINSILLPNGIHSVCYVSQCCCRRICIGSFAFLFSEMTPTPVSPRSNYRYNMIVDTRHNPVLK